MARRQSNGDNPAHYPIMAADLRRLLPSVFLSLGYEAPRIEDSAERAFASRTSPGRGYYKTSARSKAEVRWRAVKGGVVITAAAYDTTGPDPVPRADLTGALIDRLNRTITEWLRNGDRRELDRPPYDKVVAPGERFSGEYTGTLRDYSGCATEAEVEHLTRGVLPLGRWAWDFSAPNRRPGQQLYLAKFRNRGPMEHNGTLVCAPQNSGKTALLERWAKAATAARPAYAVFVIDVKGNLRQKLERRKLSGPVFHFTTDPNAASDRINFLDGPMGLTPLQTDRIRQLATALLPSRGFVEQGGENEYYYRNRVVWLTAFIHLLKLNQAYYPERYRDDTGRERNVDLCDLYELIASEPKLYPFISDLLAGEHELRKRGVTVPIAGAEHWVSEIALMLDPRRTPLGQRPERESYRVYTTGLLTALEPFSLHGTLHERVRSFGPGRLFDLESTLGGARRPVTVILSAREQDLEKADAVLAMSIKRLQWMLFDRMQQEDADKRPILLLLDETKRIRDFNPADYIAFAREARAACVIAYQSLDQIGDATLVTSLLENIGTQIYLGSLVGNTARYFVSILPKRSRDQVTRQVVRAADTETTTLSFSSEQVDYLGTAELYHLPAGAWPALIYINEQPRGKPFLVDMTDPHSDAPPGAAAERPRVPLKRPAVGNPGHSTTPRPTVPRRSQTFRRSP